MPNELEFRHRTTIEEWKDIVPLKPQMTYAIAENQVTDFTLTMLLRKYFKRWKPEQVRWNYKGNGKGHYVYKDAAIIVSDLPAHIATYNFNDWEMMMLMYAAHLFLIEDGGIKSLARQFEINPESFEIIRDNIHKLFPFYPDLEGHYLEDE